MEVGKLRSFSEVEFLKETLLQQYTGHTWEVHSCKSCRWAPLIWKKRKVEEPGERRCVFAAVQSTGFGFPAHCPGCSLEELDGTAE